ADRAGNVFQQHWNAVPDRVSQTGAAGNQFLLFPVIDQRPFGDGADQQFEQVGVHGAMIASGRVAERAQPFVPSAESRCSMASKKAGSIWTSKGADQMAEPGGMACWNSLTASFSVQINVVG